MQEGGVVRQFRGPEEGGAARGPASQGRVPGVQLGMNPGLLVTEVCQAWGQFRVSGPRESPEG